MTDFGGLDATGIAERVRSGSANAGNVAEHFIGEVLRREQEIRAFTSFDPEIVRLQASPSDAVCEGPLSGVLVGVKDIFDTASHPTEYFSPIYRGHRPTRDAHVVSLLRQAGANIVGKTHTTEFAYMHSGPTRNPHDLARTPGSSSAGSAAGLAAGFFPIALGTQTAGSLIKPASYCGLYALKPSYGLVSLEGVKPLAPSFDTVGWYGRSVRDLELVAKVLVPGLPAVVAAHSPLHLAFCRTSRWDRADVAVQTAVEHAIQTLIRAGHVVTELVLPKEFSDVFDDQQLINDCEGARSLWKEYREQKSNLSAETLAMFESAASVTWDAESAAKARLGGLSILLADKLTPFDAVVGLSCGCVAPVGLERTGPSDFIKLWTAFGLPQVNLPLPRRTGELPVGLQVVGKFREDHALLSAAQIIDASLSVNV